MCDSCRPCSGDTGRFVTDRILFLVKDFRRDFSRRFESDTADGSVTEPRKTFGKEKPETPLKAHHGFFHGNRRFIFRICPDAAGATKTRRKGKSVPGIKNGKKFPGIFRERFRNRFRSGSSYARVRPCRVLSRRQGFHTSPIHFRPAKTFGSRAGGKSRRNSFMHVKVHFLHLLYLHRDSRVFNGKASFIFPIYTDAIWRE